MKYLPGRSAAAALIPAALVMRIFWGLSVDYPMAMNAAWMCPLIGFAIFLPFACAAGQAARIGSGSIWENTGSALPHSVVVALDAAAALLMLYDCAAAVRLTASSSNIIALNDVTVHLLAVPLAPLIAGAILLGGDAVGNSARLWLRTMPLFALILFAVQYGSYRVGWLTPLFGGGLQGVAGGSLYCAGCLALLTLPWLIAVPDRQKKGPVRYFLLSALAASLLLLTQNMSYPFMTDASLTQAARIELILSNGRMSRSPQMILDVLWYGGLLYLLAAEAVTAACFLHHALPRVRIWIWAVLEGAAVVWIAILNPEWLHGGVRMELLFAPLGALFALMLLTAFLKRRDILHAEK